tara:strand:- start:507 stop:1217 length:711 start_codon:yes stop_codon:yes gene_type:complete
MLSKITYKYSPNFNNYKRNKSDIKFLIIHYTGMRKEKDAIERLINIQSEVSSHYFIKYDGKIIQLIPDLYTAWHAGKSAWGKKKLLNDFSIGIEISNTGHNYGYKNYKKKQITALIKLLQNLKKKYKIKSENILGHSDIAPVRKKDPGEKFPWKKLAKKKLSIWHKVNSIILKKLRREKCDKFEKNLFLKNISKIGYVKCKTFYMVRAFQMRFRPELVNGKIDKECLKISENLIII